MKKTILSFLLALLLNFGFGQTATNFIANDCASNSHTLFTELNSGKVIVICWVMPCATCIGPASTDANTVLAFANPNVVFYMVDDYGNTNCSTLNSWANTNQIITNAIFDNTGNNINMDDYGGAAMPKTIVLGGTNHNIYYNVNGAVNAGDLQTAINNALNDLTGLIENKIMDVAITLFPNPAASQTDIIYTLSKSSNVSIEVINILGENIRTVYLGKQTEGLKKYELKMESECAGIYFIKLKTDKAGQTIKLIINQ